MSESERSPEPLIRDLNYCRVFAGGARRVTAPAQVMPTKDRSTAMLARVAGDVRGAWAASPKMLRVLTVVAAVAASATAASDDISSASGLAIAVMVSAALVDWHTRRLPDAIVMTAAIVFGLVWFSSSVTGNGPSPVDVGLGIAVFAGPLLVLHLATPSALGFGDVKAAAVLGMAVGAVAWGLAAWALMAAAASTALVGLVLRRSTLPLGPGLVAGALSALFVVAVFGLDGIGF